MDEQTSVQRRLYARHAGSRSARYFGSIVGGYLVRRFRRYMAFPYLDAGAGNGALIQVVRKRFPEQAEKIVGVDLVGVPSLNIQEGNLSALPFEDDHFKTITCTDVLEQLGDDDLAKTLAEFRRVLIPRRGHILCTIPFDEDLSRNTIACPHCEKSFHRFGHVRNWKTKRAVQSMFRAAGLRVVFFEILPLGAVAKLPLLRLFKPLLNRLPNPPGFRKRVIAILTR